MSLTASIFLRKKDYYVSFALKIYELNREEEKEEEKEDLIEKKKMKKIKQPTIDFYWVHS